MTDDSLYRYQPREVSIETLALCNAACTFCPYPTLARKGVEMPSMRVFRLLDEMRSWSLPFFISPFKVNEPLLDGRLRQFCEYIETHLPAARIRLFTNGQPLTAKHRAWINKLRRLEHLWISLNECTEDTYRATMGLRFATTAQRLHELHDEVEAGTFAQRVVISRVMNGTRLQLSDADFEFQRYVRATWPRFQVRLIKRDGWLGYVEPSSNEVPRSACGRWFELNIMATGQVALCCMDGKGEYAIGDITAQSLLDVYNQPFLVARRISATTRQGIHPCEQCTY